MAAPYSRLTRRRLLIDHRDGNPRNNEIDNLILQLAQSPRFIPAPGRRAEDWRKLKRIKEDV